MTDRRAFYDRKASAFKQAKRPFYQELLLRHFSFLIPPGLRVLELGCGKGDLLAGVKAAYTRGLDFSSEMIRQARERYPELKVDVADARETPENDQFDYILMSDLINDLPDV